MGGPASAAASANEAAIRACVIDLGTNSFHALVVELRPDDLPRIVDKLKEPVGLIAPSSRPRRLGPEELTRAEDALRRIATLAERRGALTVRAYATSAIREASNGEAFIASMRRKLGVDIVAIAGEREAALIHRGVAGCVDLSEPCLLIDIGGGSTELVVGDSAGRELTASYKLGAARMTERFIASDPPAADELAALREHIDERLAPVVEAARRHGVRRLIGSSGTMEALVELAHRRAGRGGSIYQHAVPADELRELAGELAASKRKARAKLDGLDARRVDQIIAGAVLVDRVIEAAAIEQVEVSPAAMREGMVAELADELGEEIRCVAGELDIVRRQFLALGIRHQFDERHARHVAGLAASLFEGLAPLHGLDDGARTLLDRAALVHDVGHAVAGRRHHKHTRYIIEQARWPGIPPDDIALIALVARYHRRARPKKKHAAYGALKKRQRRLVRALAAILRVADDLDRSHVQNTRGVRVEIDDETIHLHVETRADPGLELRATERSRRAFERAFDRTLRVTAGRHG